MDWKLRIKALCQEWEIEQPDFVLSKSELRKSLQGWDTFMQKYPKIFNDADVWVKSQIKDEFMVTHARLTSPKIFGKLRGHYTALQLQDSDILILIIDSKAKFQFQETTILHEFYHHLIEQWGCVDSDEEKHAELFARSKKFRDALKKKTRKKTKGEMM